MTNLAPATNRGNRSVTPRPARHGRASPRRGVVSVLAMLYLLLFSALALGFYAATTMSAQIARNERYISEAQYAAEGGMQFMRYQLGCMDMASNTSSDILLTTVQSELGRLLNGQANMGGATVQIVDSTIYVPSQSGYVNLDAAGQSRFRGSVTQSGAFLIVTVVGQGGNRNISRAIRMKYQKAARSSAIFNYGVASKGKIVTAGSSVIIGLGDPTRGSVLSTNMTDPWPVVIGGREVSGDISIVNPFGNISYAGAKIGGTTDSSDIAANHIHKGVQEPDFPEIDVSAYTAYATNAFDKTKNNHDNVTIPPGTNPKFTGNTTIKGVMYVKAPNVVEFGGNVTIQGLIVVETGKAFNAAANRLEFTGSIEASGVETLPASYGELRKLTGAFILAPGFSTLFTGSFSTVNGSIIAGEVNFGGNAGGVVKGSIINLENVQMDVNGSSDIVIASTGTSNYPTGVTFGDKYAPLPDTYEELQ